MARSIDIDPQERIYVGGINEIGYLITDTKSKLVFQSLREGLANKYHDFGYVFNTCCNGDAWAQHPITAATILLPVRVV